MGQLCVICSGETCIVKQKYIVLYHFENTCTLNIHTPMALRYIYAYIYVYMHICMPVHVCMMCIFISLLFIVNGIYHMYCMSILWHFETALKFRRKYICGYASCDC